MTPDIEAIRRAFRERTYLITDHAARRGLQRSITRSEIEQAVAASEVIEDYPEDKYSPSCLLYGRTEKGRPLHVQISYPPAVKVITIYEPDPDKWIDYRKRK
jgi:hypothetical protein